MASSIGGTGSVIFTGSGHFTLSAPATYPGDTLVDVGTSLVLVVNAPPPGNVNISPLAGSAADFGALTYFVTNDSQGNGITSVPISGSGALIKDGPGSFSANASSTYTGGTTLLAGTLRPAGTILGSASGPLTLNGGTLFLSSSLQVGALNGSGGVLTYSGNGNFVLTLGNGDGSGSFAGSIQDGGSGHVITLTKVGSGLQVLTGTNSYTFTNANAGTLEAKYPRSLPNFGSSNLNVAAGATFAVAVGPGEWVASDLDSLIKNAKFALGSTLALDTADGAFSYGSSFTASFGLTKLGGNALTLTGSPSYSGPTLVTAGTLVVSSTGMLLGNGTVTVASGATLTNNGTVAGPLDLFGTALGSGRYNGAVTVENGGYFGGTGTINGKLTVNAGGIVMLSAGTLTVSGGVANSGTIRFEHGARLSVRSGSTFVNNGLLDVISGNFSFPPGFVNNGTVYDSSVVRAKTLSFDASTTPASIKVTIDGYTAHTYQLQRSDSLSGSTFTNIGQPQTGSTGTALTFTDPSPASGQGFYRVQVDP